MRGYRPKQAHHRAQQRQLSKPKHMKLTTGVQALIRQHMPQDWSPEQRQGRLKAEGYSIVCSSTIDAFIEQDKAARGPLYTHLRHRKPYKKRTGKADARGQMIGRLSIDDRPALVHQKTRLGDWQADTVIGKRHQGVLVTLAERVSKTTLIAPAESKHADVVKNAIVRLLLPEKEDVHTITDDTGKEFAYHAQINEALGVQSYFAHPDHSWETGLNENHNGLIRHYLPKGMSLNQVNDARDNGYTEQIEQSTEKITGL